MKLQKQKTRKDKDYYKYVIVIPSEIIKLSELKEGDELDIKTGKNEIIIKKINTNSKRK